MMPDKIALEEHFLLPSTPTPAWPPRDNPATNALEPAYFQDVHRRLVNASLRIEEMDRCGIELMVLSLNQPGVQGIPEAAKAIQTARRVNDELAERFVGAYPRRFAGFAAIPLQDVGAAGDELERAVTQLGFKGALINGYSNIGEGNAVQYLDETPVWEFWERVVALKVPVYLHPREPLERRIYQGYPALVGSAWAFGVETATQALRLIMSGLFDRFPSLTVILGHLGEGLPFLLPRLEHRLRHVKPEARGRQEKSMIHYLQENFYITTSGAFRTPAFIDTMLEVGADRILFSVDYPYETMQEQSDWFETLPISEGDRRKIGRTNAVRLIGLT